MKEKLPSSKSSADWTVVAGGLLVLGSLLTLVGALSDAEARRVFDSPEAVSVDGEVLHVYRQRQHDAGALELWRFALDGQTWYVMASGHQAIGRVGEVALRVDPEVPWRAVRDDRTPLRDLAWLVWPGGLLLALVLPCLLIRQRGLAARRRRFRRPAGRWMPARLVAVSSLPDQPGVFRIELESLDGRHRAFSEPLHFDPTDLLPTVPGIIAPEHADGDYAVDLSLLPEVRYA